MSNLTGQPKPIIVYPLSVSGNTTLPPNSYNNINLTPASSLTLTLPALVNVIDGFTFYIRNFGPGSANLVDSNDSAIATLLSGDCIILICNKELDEWVDFIGPIGGGTGVPVSGPGSSTNTAVVRWDGTTGSMLSNSQVLLDNSGNLTGIDSILATGDITMGNVLTLVGETSSFVEFNNESTSVVIECTPGGDVEYTWVLRNANDNIVGAATTDTFTNKTITDSTDTVAAQYLWSSGGLVSVNTSAAVDGYALIATSASAATWQALPSYVSGPVSATTGQVAVYTANSGEEITTTPVSIDSSGNITGVININSSGSFTLSGSVNFGGNLIFNQGSNGSLTILYTASGGASKTLTIPTITGSSDSFVLLSTAATLLNKTITDATNIVYATGLLTSGSPIIINSTTPATGDLLIASSPTVAQWGGLSSVPYSPADSENWEPSAPNNVLSALDQLGSNAGGWRLYGNVLNEVVGTYISTTTPGTSLESSLAVITVGASPANIVILPSNAGSALDGTVFQVVNPTSTTNNLVITPQSGGTINGQQSFNSPPGSVVSIVATNTNEQWYAGYMMGPVQNVGAGAAAATSNTTGVGTAVINYYSYVSTSSDNVGMVLPSIILGLGNIFVITSNTSNTSGNLLTVYPSNGTINGDASVTITAGTTMTFIGYNTGGTDIWFSH